VIGRGKSVAANNLRSKEEKLQILKEIDSGMLSARQARMKYHCDPKSIKHWREQLKTMSIRGKSTTTREQKEAAVNELIANKGKPGIAIAIAKRLDVTATAIYYWKKQMEQGWVKGDPYKVARAKRNGDGQLPVVAPKTVVAVASPRIHSAMRLLQQSEEQMVKDIRAGRIRRLSDHPDRILALNALTQLLYGDE
jgi:transposase-like protein